MNEAVLTQNVIKCLIKNFGVIETERFISIVIKELFDYTVWQRNLFDDMTVDEIFAATSAWKKRDRRFSKTRPS